MHDILYIITPIYLEFILDDNGELDRLINCSSIWRKKGTAWKQHSRWFQTEFQQVVESYLRNRKERQHEYEGALPWPSQRTS